MRLSVVIPVFNEAGNVLPLAAELKAAVAAASIDDHELIFVDDGSTDGTRAEILEAKRLDPRVRLIGLKSNKGLTAAMDTGLRRAKGEILVVIDGDGQSDPADLPRLLSALEGHDCACGIRVNRKKGDGYFKRFQSKVANATRRLFTGDRSKDSGCTFRAFRRECIARVKLFRGMHRFLPTLIRWEGFSIAEVPVNHRPRLHGKSKYGVWNRVFAVTVDLMAVLWMRSRIDRAEVQEDLP